MRAHIGAASTLAAHSVLIACTASTLVDMIVFANALEAQASAGARPALESMDAFTLLAIVGEAATSRPALSWIRRFAVSRRADRRVRRRPDTLQAQAEEARVQCVNKVHAARLDDIIHQGTAPKVCGPGNGSN